MKKLTFFFNKMIQPAFLPLVIGFFLWIHSSLIGLTDDEAYYWLLAQTPAWGYAYHPPIVAWCIWISEQFFSIFGFFKHAIIVRAPAVLITVVSIYFFIFWLKISPWILKKSKEDKNEILDKNHVSQGLWTFLTFAGIFGISWMMVPDLPLIIGYLGLFVFTWILCFGSIQKDSTTRQGVFLYFLSLQNVFVILGLSAFVSILSKFTAVFAVLSSLICLYFFARENFKKGFLALAIGFTLGLVPIFIWNAQNEWGAFLYHLSDRHQGGHFSWLRYSRFWLVTFVGAGPILFLYFITLFKRIFSKDLEEKKLSRFILIWVLPAALVFCIQPAFSDFKPHWVLLVIFPVLLEFCFWTARGKFPIQNRVHKVYGVFFLIFIFTASHFPIVSFIIEKSTGNTADPRYDVTNDLYGWDPLYLFVIEKCGMKCLDLPVVGSRYQTTAQAAFVWPKTKNVTRVPRTVKEYDEFPKINEVAHQGPDWPELLDPILFVSDNRFHQPPEFMNAECVSLGKLETYRFSYLAKWVQVYYCTPHLTKK